MWPGPRGHPEGQGGFSERIPHEPSSGGCIGVEGGVRNLPGRRCSKTQAGVVGGGEGWGGSKWRRQAGVTPAPSTLCPAEDFVPGSQMAGT